jgi:hypothetical protein
MAKDEKGMTDSELHRKLLALWKRGQSDLCEIQCSSIHGSGVYATRDIAADELIIEYVGEFIDKEQSSKRSTLQLERSAKNGDAAVFIFNINSKWDLDGNVPWNTARLINHSCSPNCEAQSRGKKIFIHALRKIKQGEELTYDYGFDVECYEEHPCLCRRDGCVGYIVSRDQWHILDDKLGRGKTSEKAS